MTNARNNDLERFRQTAEGLNRLTVESIKSIPESVFINKLLPIMREWVVERKGDRVHLWAIAAGGIERPMIVTLPDNSYFMVPPPYNHLSSVNARDDRENDRIDAINRLIRTREQDGETREAMRLSDQLFDVLNIQGDEYTQALYTIQLAKIWDRYQLPMEEILADLSIDLNLYDEFGRYIAGSEPETPTTEEDHGDDEFEF